MSDRSFKLSPSDFAFLWEECKRCFFLKVVNGLQRPHSIMPKIFTVIDTEIKKCFEDKSTTQFLSSFPKGKMRFKDEWVESTAVQVSGHSSKCYLRGKLDTVIEFEDSGYAVIDFKTTGTKDEHVPLYGRQLHAYAYALEHPATRALALKPIRRLGLLVFEPSAFAHGPNNQARLWGALTWIEVPRDDQAFLRFLGEVMDVLEQPEPPAGADKCPWCTYRQTSRRTGL